jgi:acyl-CoA synthetase (AMP-forming)/AMP-acid ligase II
MLPASPLPLGASLLASGRGLAARFIADEKSSVTLARVTGAAEYTLPASVQGRSILLALPGQLATIAAMIALDGVARRIVLWPHDIPHARIAEIMGPAAVDLVVTQWPLPAGVDHPRTAQPHAVHSPTEWVLFTSGTTGRPKMVVHTLETLAGHIAAPPAGSSPIWCTFYDIRRYGGLQVALRALLGGGSLVLSCPDEAPAAFLARAAIAGATHFLGTPSHWRRALMTDAALSIAPVYVRLSGEVADQMILDKLRSAYANAAIVHAFASTEAGLAFEVVDGLAGFPAALVEHAAGPAEIRIADGTLQIRSARNAAGYLDGSLSGLAGEGGFVDTGDVVELRNGRYYFAGRRDGTVNVGGQKVHPEEVEAVINQHPDVEMSLVTGRRSPITGAIVVAHIVVRASGRTLGAQALEADIKAFCRMHLPPHKVPASVRAVPHLDIAPSGKLVRLSA